MTTALVDTAQPATLGGATISTAHWQWLEDVMHRRAGRIEGILAVLTMLLPQSVLTLLR